MEKCKEKAIVFWGAGKIGNIVLRFCKMLGEKPDFFVDKNESLWGKQMDGIIIKSPKELANMRNMSVFITMKKYDEVLAYLLEMGMDEKDIVTYSSDFVGSAIKSLISRDDFTMESDLIHKCLNDAYQVLIDLQNGLVLGGVEKWCKQLAFVMSQRGYSGKYLVPNLIKENQWEDSFEFLPLYDGRISDAKERLEICVNAILACRPCTIVCNFVGYTLYAACIAKRVSPDSVRVIAVNHSDDPAYYTAYVLWQDYIDQCLSVSGRIKENLIEKGFCQAKIKNIVWKVACDEHLRRNYSDRKNPIRIGYAGRITTVAKRADLLIVIAVLLREMKVAFHMVIAGEGEYSGRLEEQIRVMGLSEYVSFMHRIQEEMIPEFWKSVDLCLCPSEWEGHSISLCEAMAQGAVPIATDVSGVRDDIKDTVNGFVVDVGDLFEIVNKIKLLSENRELLYDMGTSAYITMKKRNENAGDDELVELLLGEKQSGK